MRPLTSFASRSPIAGPSERERPARRCRLPEVLRDKLGEVVRKPEELRRRRRLPWKVQSLKVSEDLRQLS